MIISARTSNRPPRGGYVKLLLELADLPVHEAWGKELEAIGDFPMRIVRADDRACFASRLLRGTVLPLLHRARRTGGPKNHRVIEPVRPIWEDFEASRPADFGPRFCNDDEAPHRLDFAIGCQSPFLTQSVRKLLCSSLAPRLLPLPSSLVITL